MVVVTVSMSICSKEPIDAMLCTVSVLRCNENKRIDNATGLLAHEHSDCACMSGSL